MTGTGQAGTAAHAQVLAAVDASAYSESVGHLAAWAATRLDAPLELLHVLDRHPERAPAMDLSGSLDLGAKSALLAQLAALDEERSRLARQRGRALLDGLAARLRAHYGLEPATTLRNGSLVDTLTGLEQQVRLFVIGNRGEHADFARGHLGSQLERVVRAVHRPLLVASRQFAQIGRMLIAFDNSPSARKGVAMVADSPLFAGLAIQVLTVSADNDAARAALDWARERLARAGLDVSVQRLPGDPDQVIAAQVDQGGIDLLVMGAYGHSRIRRLIVGSTTTTLLRTCRVPVLLLR
ncbi:MAG: universal stress protein [Xanthomonadales bacterium]|nr:universal stress protein [Xanthomonadales bacterium]